MDRRLESRVASRESEVTHHDSRGTSRESLVERRSSRAEIPEALSRRAVVERVRPQIDGGRFPIKRTVGEPVEVRADVFADGHDVVVAILRHRQATTEGTEHTEFNFFRTPAARNLSSASDDKDGDSDARLKSRATYQTISVGSVASAVACGGWLETPMTLVAPGTDEWTARFEVDALGWHEYAIVAWVDAFRTWRRDLEIKAAAGQDVSVELLEGSLLVREAAEEGRLPASDTPRSSAEARGRGTAKTVPAHGGGAPCEINKDDADWLLTQADALSDSTPPAERMVIALGDKLAAVMDLYADRSRATTTAPLRVWVDRERARFGAWYEMFPRSAGPDPTRSGTFREAAAHLSYVADLGFDVVYLPPIHPIGRSFRKGRNNSLAPAPADPGSPWAIGSHEGGHTAIEPGLGSFDDFAAFREEAERLGLEVALDLAWQCSPDHPWVREHPEWVGHRPDGTIKYAENPPKKYQDIYPLDFACDDWRALWRELLRVTLFWIDHGVRMFRVDNPHTKTFGFWEWLVDQVHARDPRVVFLSEAFTRPAPMRHLAKAGFTQSYTYFTWRNTKDEIAEYFTELNATDVAEYLRPNLFANTPDILHAYLQEGGRPAFEARLLLAATLGASYGIYSGFELAENRAVRAGSEEYADSEKYEFRKWDWDRPGHIKELVARVNQVRHQQAALQVDRTLRFHETDNPQIVAYSKTAPDGSALVFVIVNLDPHHMQHGHVAGPLDSAQASYVAHDLLDDTTYTWRGAWNYVRFDPGMRQGHVLTFSHG